MVVVSPVYSASDNKPIYELVDCTYQVTQNVKGSYRTIGRGSCTAGDNNYTYSLSEPIDPVFRFTTTSGYRQATSYTSYYYLDAPFSFNQKMESNGNSALQAKLYSVNDNGRYSWDNTGVATILDPNQRVDSVSAHFFVPARMQELYGGGNLWNVFSYSLMQYYRTQSVDSYISTSLTLRYRIQPNTITMNFIPSSVDLKCEPYQPCSGEVDIVTALTGGTVPLKCGVNGFDKNNLQVEVIGNSGGKVLEPGAAPVILGIEQYLKKLRFNIRNSIPGTGRTERVNLQCAIE